MAVREGAVMRPFFSFYGGKWRDAVKHYPAPSGGTIVEPFAGAAGYSTRYFDRAVLLCDVDPLIVSTWQYLIRVRASEVLALPDVPDGATVDDLAISLEARLIIGWWLNKGASSPRKSPCAWMRSGIRPGSFWGPKVRARLAAQVEKIRHWRIHHVSFENCPRPDGATFFVDPPYRGPAGTHYRYGSEQIDYGHLARWCRALPGQTIVCESAGADWMDFRPLGAVKTARKGRRSAEAVYVEER